MAEVGDRDVVDTVLGFARTLRAAGVPASPDRVEAMLAALGSLDVLDPTDVYWAGRLTLCGGPDDLDRYDAAFAAYFAGEAPRARRPAAQERPQLSTTAPLEPGTGEGDDADAPDLATQASADEVLRHRDVAEMSVAEKTESVVPMVTALGDPCDRSAAGMNTSSRARESGLMAGSIVLRDTGRHVTCGPDRPAVAPGPGIDPPAPRRVASARRA